MSTKVIKRKPDRLSNLPDPIIYHILSLTNTKYAVQTCVLSKKWRHHWTHIHSLNFDIKSFSTRVAFGKFVLRILQHRKPFNLHRLRFLCGYLTKSTYMNRILEYAISHGVEELETDLDDFPPFFYKCETLATLKLLNYYLNADAIISFKFSSLSTLEVLANLKLSSENNNRGLFSNFLNLKNLILESCYVSSTENFTIVSPSLVYLKISSLSFYSDDKKIVISVPRLEFLDLNVMSNTDLMIYKCPLIRKMNIRIKTPVAWRETIDWKQEYFWELICMSGRNIYIKPGTLLTFNFSKGKFMSCNQISAYSGTAVSEMNEVEGKRLWFFDGEMVWQSFPS